jgi:lycopene cyclase domain-containing protein
MMQIEYLLVLCATIVVPLLRSGDSNLPFRTKRRALSIVVAVVSVPYWIWDIIATARGHWWFNPLYVLDARLFGLPLEEFLFFPVIAFTSIFVWETVKYFTRRK